MSDPLKLPPGYLVTLSTRIEPPPEYSKTELREPELRSDGSEIEEWKTTKILADKAEYDEATAARLKVRALVKSACVATSFGFICPKTDAAKLDAALAQARELTDAFNANSTTYKVKWASLRGEIAENAAEAVAAIKTEVSGLIAEMDAALKGGDVKKLRALASQAAGMGPLLGDAEATGRGALDKAVKAYRRVARAVVKRVVGEGEALADVLHEANLEPVAQARFLFEVEAEGEVVDAEYVEEGGEEEADEAADFAHEPEPTDDDAPVEDEEDAAPVVSEIAASILGELASALKQFGEYAFDDKGPDEVMDAGAIRARLDALPAEEAAAVLQELCDHSERGATLAGSLLIDMEGCDEERWAVLISRPDVADAGGYGEPTAKAKAIPITKASSLGALIAAAAAKTASTAPTIDTSSPEAFAAGLGIDPDAGKEETFDALGKALFKAEPGAQAETEPEPEPVADARFGQLEFGEPESEPEG